MSGSESERKGATSRIEFELPPLADGSTIELEILCGSPGEGESARRLGRWRFKHAKGGPAVIEIEWGARCEEMACLEQYGKLEMPVALDFDEGQVVRPRMTARVIGGPLTLEFPIHVTDTDALQPYYRDSAHQDEYVVQHPFFHAFHKARLRTMKRVFQKYIPPGSRVLDVGSGYSMFFLISTDWDYDITCADLDSAAIEKMRGLVPGWRWVVSDALDLPFDDTSFDALYAGEIIEHLPDTARALEEWHRVLTPDGTLILTTPNRDRLLSRANRAIMPVHPEHTREMNLQEARTALSDAGFDPVHVTGIYLELALNWYRPGGSRVDMLISLAGGPRHEPLYRPFMWMGKIAPSRAYDLVIVCKKRQQAS